MANSINLPLDEMMKTLHYKAHANISRIKKEISAISEIEKRCSELKVLLILLNELLTENRRDSKEFVTKWMILFECKVPLLISSSR